MEIEEIPFKFSGESLTSLARKLWNNNEEIKSINILMAALPLSEADCINVCTGKLKLVGDNDILLLTDDVKSKSLIDVLKEKNKDKIYTSNSETIVSQDKPEETIKPDPTCSARNGWISPNGDFFACDDYAQHEETASKLGFSGLELENQKWIKIIDPNLKDSKDIILYTDNLTQAQIDTVFIWCQKMKISFPKYLLEK